MDDLTYLLLNCHLRKLDGSVTVKIIQNGAISLCIMPQLLS